MGGALGFASFVIKREVPANGAAALESVCPIDQEDTLRQNAACVVVVRPRNNETVYTCGRSHLPAGRVVCCRCFLP